ncbi:unnamed protein product [Clonostachys solani]|uniref:Heterokaryon incompatibility domain-containing protein n=1 Tax=Clonostachys solani TaxID=160281 RepID=A0A9N9W7V4_9HYPO|nr:unnamed protein product [Clonostachys solani]
MYAKIVNNRQIRLMTLDAGQAGDPVICRLRHVRLSMSLKFEALSYEWKQAEGSTSITCNGTKKIADITATTIAQRPKQGSIIKSQQDYTFLSHDRDSVLWQTIRRHPELDDDAIFRFHDQTVWDAIDRLFYDSYFGRSWIIQEVAVAEMVHVVCGSFKLHWDIFRMAYEGRIRLLFQRFRNPGADNIAPLIPFVRDARVRYRNRNEPNSKCLDLGIVLNSFSYSNQTDPRDKVYAALGLVHPRSLCAEIVPDYNKPTEDVFYETSCHIIRLRKDLYLWSCMTLMSRRSMVSLPSWVPEWTMQPCEEAVEFASAEFSQCLRGNPVIHERSLFVDGHLVDTVDTTFSFSGDHEEFELVKRLEQWLKEHDKSLFGEYAAGLIDDSATTTLSRGSRAEATQLLREFDDIPPLVAKVIRNVKDDDQCPLSNSLLNIEAMWSTLTAIFKKRFKAPESPGYRLFLAILYMLPTLEKEGGSIRGGLPQSFNSWIMAAVLLITQGRDTKLFNVVFSKQFQRNDSFQGIEDSFFVTKKGFFGRAPAETVKRGQLVAILGGAYVPYLLERQNGHYRLMSHVYLEGIMTINSLPRAWKVERIEIR